MIAPKILQWCTSVRIVAGVIVFFEVADRQQFYRRYPQFLEIWNFFHETEKRAWMLHLGGRMARKSPHMEFVNNRVGEGIAERLVCPPGKVVLHHQTPSCLYRPGRTMSPLFRPTERTGIGIKQEGLPRHSHGSHVCASSVCDAVGI